MNQIAFLHAASLRFPCCDFRVAIPQPRHPLIQSRQNQQANELYDWCSQRSNDKKLNRCCRSQGVMSFTLIWSWPVLGKPCNLQAYAWLSSSEPVELTRPPHPTPAAAPSMRKLSFASLPGSPHAAVVKSMPFAPCSPARPRQHPFLVAALLLCTSLSLPIAPALAANRCWFGEPASSPAVLPACSDPAFSFELIDRFYLRIITLPTQGAGTIDFALSNSDEIMAVDVKFIPPLESAGSSSPLSGVFNYQLSISPFDTDYFFSASLALTPPAADPPPEPAAITLVQQIPEANLSLSASDASPVSLYRESDPLKSITLLGQFTLHSGSLSSIHNGFGIFFIDPPEAVPGPLPLCGAAMAFGYSRRLRRRLLLSRQHRGDLRCGSDMAPAGQSPRPSGLAAADRG